MDPTIIGGALGAIARFAPEVLNFYDRKAKRAHDIQVLEKTQAGANQLAALEALKAGITAQAQPSGVKWVDALNSLIRPLITFQWVIVLYPAALILQWVAAFAANGQNLAAAVEATRQIFGPDEKALCSFIVNFWFLNRVLSKGGAA